MPIQQKQLAERWEVTPGRISQLVAQGLPLTSIEDAERWIAERHIETGQAPKNFKLEPDPNAVLEPQPSTESQNGIETFDAIVQRQRMLVRLSCNQYVKAVREGSPQQSRLYASYDKTVNTLTKLKAEADRLLIMNREYIRASDAAEAMKQLVSEVLNILDKLPLDCAENCNPENPAKAVKVLEAWKRRAQLNLSKFDE